MKDEIQLSKDLHIDRLTTLDVTNIDHDKFRTVRGQLLFISQSTRPDIAYDVAQLCQVPYKATSTENVAVLNDVVKHLEDTKSLVLRYPLLKQSSLKMYVFVDSGYNTNVDGTSQLGMVICLVDQSSTFHFVYWSSWKCQRVTRSMLAVETYAFSHGFDYGISLRMLLKSMKLDIPLYIFTDSKCIFDTITSSKRLRELRLMN